MSLKFAVFCLFVGSLTPHAQAAGPAEMRPGEVRIRTLEERAETGATSELSDMNKNLINPVDEARLGPDAYGDAYRLKPEIQKIINALPIEGLEFEEADSVDQFKIAVEDFENGNQSIVAKFKAISQGRGRSSYRGPVADPDNFVLNLKFYGVANHILDQVRLTFAKGLNLGKGRKAVLFSAPVINGRLKGTLYFRVEARRVFRRISFPRRIESATLLFYPDTE